MIFSHEPCSLPLGSSILLSLGAPSSGWIPCLLRPSLNITTSPWLSSLLYWNTFTFLLLSYSSNPPVNLVKIYLETKCFSPTPCWSATLIFFLSCLQCLPCWSLCFTSLVNRVSSSLYSQNLIKVQIRSCRHLRPSLVASCLHIRENCSPYSGQKPWTIWASTSLISDHTHCHCSLAL